jgi:hypothetical protein
MRTAAARALETAAHEDNRQSRFRSNAISPCCYAYNASSRPTSVLEKSVAVFTERFALAGGELRLIRTEVFENSDLRREGLRRDLRASMRERRFPVMTGGTDD